MRLTRTTHFEEGTGLVVVPATLKEYREACAHHYRESVDFFGLFLDRDHLGYSCGIWGEHDTLADSMARKYATFAEMLPSNGRVLEVGSGFGGLSQYLSATHEVHAYNLSKTQHDHCQEANPNPHTLHYHNKCWTQIEGTYDAIVSDEFIVHTGGVRAEFFQKMRSVIKKGGVFALKNLSINHTTKGCAGPASMANIDIFGGNGSYPAYFQTLADADAAGFARESSISLPIRNYVQTAHAWRDKVQANSEALKAINETLFYDVWRMFKLYLRMFESGVLTIEMTKFRAV